MLFGANPPEILTARYPKQPCLKGGTCSKPIIFSIYVRFQGCKRWFHLPFPLPDLSTVWVSLRLVNKDSTVGGTWLLGSIKRRQSSQSPEVLAVLQAWGAVIEVFFSLSVFGVSFFRLPAVTLRSNYFSGGCNLTKKPLGISCGTGGRSKYRTWPLHVLCWIDPVDSSPFGDSAVLGTSRRVSMPRGQPNECRAIWLIHCEGFDIVIPWMVH